MDRPTIVSKARDQGGRSTWSDETIVKALASRNPSQIQAKLPTLDPLLHKWVGEKSILRPRHPLEGLTPETLASLGRRWEAVLGDALQAKRVLIGRGEAESFARDLEGARDRFLGRSHIAPSVPSFGPPESVQNLERLFSVLAAAVEESRKQGLDILVTRGLLPQEATLMLTDFRGITDAILRGDRDWFETKMRPADTDLVGNARSRANATLNGMAPQRVLLQYSKGNDRILLDEDDELFAYYSVMATGWKPQLVSGPIDVEAALNRRLVESALIEGEMLKAFHEAVQEILTGHLDAECFEGACEYLGIEVDDGEDILSAYRKGKERTSVVMAAEDIANRASKSGGSVLFVNG